MRQNVDSSMVVVAVSATLAAVLVAGVMFWRQKKQFKKQECPLQEMSIPTKWTKIGEVGELIMYPLKGAKRRCLSEAVFTERGLKDTEKNKLALQDRVFVIYNDQHDFMNIKKNTKMLFLETTAVDKTTVRFSFPDTADLVIQIPETNSTLNHVELYNGEIVKTVDCGDAAATWFSQRLLNKTGGLRLGCFVESLVPPRTIKGSYEKHAEVYTRFHSDYMGSYSDIASYMIMGEDSLKDLNSRLVNPVTEHHFRPNLMIRGSPAFNEDGWEWIKIGDQVILRGFKYCTRCTVTAINPDTAEIDPNTEPLRTLRKYRQVKEPELKKLEGYSPVMGLYAGCHRTGIVRVGDPVYINAE